MKIAMLSWESLHSARAGGLAVVVTRLSEELVKRGHEVCIFTRKGSNEEPEFSTHNGVEYRRVSATGNDVIELSYNLSRAITEAVHNDELCNGKFDIIHGHDWHVVQALHDLKRGHKIVFTLHSTEYGRRGNNRGTDWFYREISGKEWYGTYLADAVVAVSETFKREVQWLYNVPCYKITAIRNGVTYHKYRIDVDPGRIKEKYGIHPLAPTVLFVGRIAYQKGPDLLVEAIPHVLKNRWDVKFIIAGQGEMMPWVENRVNQLGVRDAVRFPGFVDYWEYIRLLNASDIVCIPSRNEPWGLVLLEAWSAGKPVVATDVGGLGETISNFVDGVKVYAYPESVAWGINYLLNNPDKMKEISSNALESAKRYSWDEPVEKLLSLYKEILER